MKKLTHIANQRKRARRIRRATKKPSKGLATKLLEGTPKGDVTVELQEDLMRVSACENCIRFTRCTKCSFMHGQFSTDIGLLAEGPGVGHIMEGTYSPWQERNNMKLFCWRNVKCLRLSRTIP